MINRREFLGLTLSSAFLLSTAGRAESSEFILRNHRPNNLETPVQGLRSFLTSNDEFYIRSHHAEEPVVDPSRWKLSVEGAIARPASWNLDQLRSRETSSLVALLQCSGNGRYKYRPRIPGGAWERGALGNAQWTGVSLRALLEEAGLATGARYLVMHGVDKPVVDQTPKFAQVLPLAKALDPDTMIAFEMNGSPLSHLHGFPARLVVPGWQGQKWVKWLSRLEVTEHEPDEWWYRKSYRVPADPVPPGADVPQEAMVPVEEMLVKSILVNPLTQSRFRLGQKVLLQGKAWTGGKQRVRSVEVATGDGWKAATLMGEDLPYTWRAFELAWTPTKPGRYLVKSRATDSAGARQPEKAPWNPGGYNWNGIEEIHVEVV